MKIFWVKLKNWKKLVQKHTKILKGDTDLFDFSLVMIINCIYLSASLAQVGLFAPSSSLSLWELWPKTLAAFVVLEITSPPEYVNILKGSFYSLVMHSSANLSLCRLF